MPTKDELKAEIAQLNDELANQSDTYAELDNDYTDLSDSYAQLSDKFSELNEEYEQILGQLRWTHTMLAITIEEQGGIVEVARSVAETYDGNLKTIKMYDLEEQGIVRVEVTDTEEPIEGEIVE